MEQLKITLKTSKLQKTFSEAFKKQVVKEYEQGLLNKYQLQVKYGLGGNSTVLKWCLVLKKVDYKGGDLLACLSLKLVACGFPPTPSLSNP